MRVALALALGVLAGCSTVSTTEQPTREAVIEAALPPARSFPATRPIPAVRSNANIAADFIDLHFMLESGAELPVFTRFEQPVTVQLTGKPPATMQADLTRLLSRIRRETGIDIQ